MTDESIDGESSFKPKSTRSLVSSLNEELTSIKKSFNEPHDIASSTGQFLTSLMREMAEPVRQEFIMTATRLAIEAVQNGKQEVVLPMQHPHVVRSLTILHYQVELI